MAQLIDCYDALFRPEDGGSSIRHVLVEVLRRAREDKVRLRIEIRVASVGTVASRQEAILKVDPELTDPDTLIQKLIDQCEDSPGPEFHGQLRLNFSPEGHAGQKYQSWTRQIHHKTMGTVGLTHAHHHDDDEDLDPNESYGLVTGDASTITAQQYAQMEQFNRMIVGQLETAMGFNWRSMAQQQAMFERVIRVLESIVLRFGFQDPAAGQWPQHPGIEMVPAANGDRSDPPAAPGLLQTLLATVATMANSTSPGDALKRAGSLAAGQPPPQAAIREAAVRGAGALVNRMGPPEPASPALPAPGVSPPPRLPSPHRTSHAGPGDVEDGSLVPWQEGDGLDGSELDPDAGAPYGPDELDFDPGVGPQDPEAALAAMQNLPPEDMQELVVSWIKAQPDRTVVMGMLPQIQAAITGGD